MSKVPKDWRTPQGDLLRDLKEAEAEIARLREAIEEWIICSKEWFLRPEPDRSGESKEWKAYHHACGVLSKIVNPEPNPPIRD